jgi:DNA polymerase-3 subunit beta
MTLDFLEEAETEIAPAEVRFRVEGTKTAFEGLFDKAISAIPSKDLLPVLKNFRVEAQQPVLRVVSTDLELSVLASTSALTVLQDGIIVLPAKKMMEILQQCPQGHMSIEVTGDSATIQHTADGKNNNSATEWRLRLQRGDDFPKLPDVQNVELHEIDKVKFINALNGVRYAAATSSVRPSLQMIDITNGKVTACDGVRLQQVFLGSDFPMNLQVPINAVDDLTTLLKLTEESLHTIKIGETENHLVFEVQNDTYLLNKLVVAFAPVEALLLTPAMMNKDKFTVERADLLAAVKRVRITADEDISAVSLELNDDELSVSAQDALGNTSHERVPIVYKGSRQLILNHKYLAEMLMMYVGSTCSFYLGTDTKTKKSAILLKDDETSTFGVINQMKKDWLS